MALVQRKYAVGIFPNHQAVEQALNQLKEAGLSLDKVSVIAKNQNGERKDQLAGADISNSIASKAGEVATVGAIAGGAAGSILGLLEGLVALSIPGVGPVIVAGAFLANTLLGSGLGAAGGGLIGALVGWGVPGEQARFYIEQVSQGNYLVIVKGTESEIHRIQSIFATKGIQDWKVFNPS
ncbi:hypothetical protein CEN50_15655 [Fischerella thermalis CCMEE 5268]|uniref:General stress protein 17M-like domain-containing protein n=1 Tax=Fischerella thermalis CCMEE 5268 TaxID=2019662 RepID=A0A2N6KEA1_9CYAN|nr:hypothetical protein [Fischerella thermalis]PLZ97303.1 hypothetical protein CEN50_15655 [Fischerella thermalis CCMEE 5268]